MVVAALLHVGTPAVAQTLSPSPDTFRTPPKEVTAPQGRFLTHLIEDTLIDFKRLPSEETLTLLGIGATIAAIGGPADRPSSNMMSSSRALEDVFAPGESLGGARMQLAGAAATYIIGRAAGHGRISELGADLLRAQFVTQALTAAVKLTAKRQRPDGTMYSFPSGHSSVSFATATVLQRHFGWKVGAPAYGFATYIAASRLQEKRHFLSDVAFGAAVGIAVGRTVTIGRGDKQFAVTPMAVPGGGGVSFNWVGGNKP
ncbi:MAG: phosphatase PAP2 family protein [Vicinamibacterales bacterium]